MMAVASACGSNANNSASPSASSTTTATQTEENQPPTENKEVTVSLLTSQAKYKEAYKKIAQKLKDEEKITLDIQVVPDDQYYNLVKTKIATKEVPDILMNNAPSEYITVDAPKNMVDLSNEPWVPRLANPDLLKAEDENIYAMPIESSSFYSAAYYNKKVFQDLGLSEPKTYAEFLNVLETIKSKGNGITPIYMSDKDSWTTQIFMTIGLPVLLGDEAQETWDKLLTNQMKWADIPEFKTILTDFVDLYNKGYVNKDHMTATFDNAKEALATGKAAMLYNGEWAVGDLLTKNMMDPEQLGAFIIPFGDKQIMGTGAFVQGFFIPKESKNVEAAKRVLNLISQPAYMNLYYAENPGSPGFKDVDGGSAHPAVKALVDNYITTNQYIAQMNDPMAFVSPIFPDLWQLYADMTIQGGKTPDEVIASWDKKYADYMKQKEQPGF
jgi:raffinose/stachyose/melibiose transport system substrate-binding protein